MKKPIQKKYLVRSAGVVSVLGIALLSPAVASASTQSATTTVNASVGSTITITSSTTVNVSVTPTSSGSMSSSSDTVTVGTNNALGYTLTFADGDATTSLVNGANTITADPGTQAAPSATLTNNNWGYRVDGVGGFGAGPTTTETNVASSAFKWAGVPATGSPNTLKTTSTTASADVTTVWYGVKVDQTKPNGTYTDTVTYTATTN